MHSLYIPAMVFSTLIAGQTALFFVLVRRRGQHLDTRFHRLYAMSCCATAALVLLSTGQKLASLDAAEATAPTSSSPSSPPDLSQWQWQLALSMAQAVAYTPYAQYVLLRAESGASVQHRRALQALFYGIGACLAARMAVYSALLVLHSSATDATHALARNMLELATIVLIAVYEATGVAGMLRQTHQKMMPEGSKAAAVDSSAEATRRHRQAVVITCSGVASSVGIVALTGVWALNRLVDQLDPYVYVVAVGAMSLLVVQSTFWMKMWLLHSRRSGKAHMQTRSSSHTADMKLSDVIIDSFGDSELSVLSTSAVSRGVGVDSGSLSAPAAKVTLCPPVMPSPRPSIRSDMPTVSQL